MGNSAGGREQEVLGLERKESALKLGFEPADYAIVMLLSELVIGFVR